MADRLDELERKIRGGPSRIDELEMKIRGEQSAPTSQPSDPTPPETEYKIGPFTRASSPPLTLGMQPTQPYDYRRGWPDLYPLYSPDIDRRRQQMFDELSVNRPDLQAAQQYRTPATQLGGSAPSLSGVERVMTAAQGASTLRPLAARLGLALGVNPEAEQFPFGSTFGEMANEPQLAAETLQAIPPRDWVEGVQQGIGTAGQTAIELFGPGSPIKAAGIASNVTGRNLLGRMGLGLAERGLAGHAASLALSAPGYQAPGALTAYLGGEKSGLEALGEVAASPVTLPIHLAQSAMEVPGDIASGDPERIAKGVGEGAVLALPFLAGKRAKGRTNERQVQAPAEGQKESRLLTREETPSTTQAPVAEQGVSAPEPTAAPPQKATAVPVAKPVKVGGGDILVDPIAKVPFVRKYSPSMVDVVAARGGKAGQVIGKLATRAIRDAKRFGGELENEVLDFIKYTRGGIVRGVKQKLGSQTEKARTEAYKSLDTVEADPTNPEFGFTRLALQADPSNTPQHMKQLATARTPEEAEMVRLYSIPIQKQMKIAQREGTLLFDPKQQSFVDLNGYTAPKFPRSPADFLIWILSHKTSPEFKKLDAYVRATPENKGIGFRQAESELARRGADNIEKVQGQVEVARPIKSLPTHMKDRNGKWQNLFVTDPHESLTKATRSAAHRIAFNKNFGQQVQGKGSTLWDRLGKIYVDEYNGDRQAFVDLGKALNDRPLANYERYHFGRPGGAVDTYIAEPIRAAKNVVTSSLLTAAGPVQATELPGATIPFTGHRNTLKGVVNAAKNIKGFRNKLRASGTITTEPGSGRINKENKLRSVGEGTARALRNAPMPLPFDPMNEINETAGGLASEAKAQQLQAGKGRGVDSVTLRSMGFTQPEIKAIMSGGGTPELYTGVQNQLAGTQPSMLARAEKSWLANTRGASFIPFQNYLQHTLRLHAKTGAAVAEGWKTGNKLGATELAGRYLFGRAVQGSTTAAMLAWLAGAADRREEEGAVEAAFNDLATSTATGPINSATDAIRGKTSLTEAVGGISVYPRLGDQLLDIWSGKGPNAGAPVSDKALKTIETLMPGLKNRRGFMALMGWSDSDMDAALRAGWKWYDKNRPIGERTAPKPENAVFNYRIKQAYNALKIGNTEKAEMLIDAALAAQGRERKDARQRLGGRKMLTRLSAEEMTSMEKYVGSRKMQILKNHDALIDNFNWSSPEAGRFFEELDRLRNLKDASGAKNDAELRDKIGLDNLRKLKRFESVERSLKTVRDAKDRTGMKHYQDTIDRVLKEQYGRQEQKP